MEFLRSLLKILDTSMEVPTPYGWFHLLFFFMSIASGILLCRIPCMRDEKNIRKFIFITALINAVLEIYKQINFSTSYSGESITFSFPYYSFPFQFCSMPMYVGLLTGIFRKGKIYSSLLAFLATYSVFGGLCVMFYPVQVFIGTIGINIQTMFCHGSMLIVGIYLFGTRTVKTESKTILKAAPVFAAAMLSAMLMNEIVYYMGIPENDSFNMFYISRHFDSSLPVYSLVHAALPYPLALAVYFAAFTLASYLVLLAAKGIVKLIECTTERIKAKRT